MLLNSDLPKAPGRNKKALPVAVSATPAETAIVDSYAAFAGKSAGERKEIGGIAYRWCPATGAEGFLMGSPADEPERSEDEVQHRVMLTRGFWLAETELTQAQWTKVMDSDLRAQAAKALADDTAYLTRGRQAGRAGLLRHEQNGSRRAADSCGGSGTADVLGELGRRHAILPARDGRARCAAPLPEGWKVTLPTEAQWEEACRAGTSTAVYSGEMIIKGRSNAPVLDAIAWYGGNSGVGFGTALGWPAGAWEEKQYEFTVAAPLHGGAQDAQ